MELLRWAMSLAVAYFWHFGIYVCLILKEVQVLPCPVNCIMRSGFDGIAYIIAPNRAVLIVEDKLGTSLKRNVYMKRHCFRIISIWKEFYTGNLSRVIQLKSGSEFSMIHPP